MRILSLYTPPKKTEVHYALPFYLIVCIFFKIKAYIKQGELIVHSNDSRTPRTLHPCRRSSRPTCRLSGKVYRVGTSFFRSDSLRNECAYLRDSFSACCRIGLRASMLEDSLPNNLLKKPPFFSVSSVLTFSE